MIADFVTWTPDATSPVGEGLRALRAVQAASTEDPLLVGFTPVARNNPYQAQLYRAFIDNGIAPSPVTRPWDFARLADLSSLATVAVHFHWLSFVLEGARTLKEGKERVSRFFDNLDSFRAAGGKTVWTVHNVLPHDATYPDLEIDVRTGLATRADVVHFMSPSGIMATEDTILVDSLKTVFSPHPSYKDCYPQGVTRAEARVTLGIEPDELVYVVFGALKPYKDLPYLLKEFDSLSRRVERRVRLIVAGMPDHDTETQAFVGLAEVHPDVLIAPRRIAPEHVQYYVGAADIGIISYARSLNSGAAMLYQTFGLPVVVPNVPSLLEALAPGTYAVYERNEPGLLAAALADAAHLATPPITETVLEALLDLDPESVSRSFGRSLRERLLAAPSAV